MGALIRATDWSGSPLGPRAAWPQSLQIALNLCLNSRFPMFVWWGGELINLYNDAYVPILGMRHPRAMGRPARESWEEIWPVVGPQAEIVMRRGEATWNERVLLVMERHGFTEETYFTWSYSPIYDSAGRVAGLFCACTEDTARVKAERERDRMAAQRQLALDAARMGWWNLDLATLTYTGDERHAAILDMPGSSGTYDAFLARVHPADVGTVRDAMRAAVRPDDPVPYAAEYRVVARDGSVRWVAAQGLTTFAGEGAGRCATHVVGTVADVTQRRRTEEQSRTILESISDAFFALDRDWRFTYANRQAERVLDRKPGELLGRNIWAEYPPLLGSDFERIYRGAMNGTASSVTSFYPDHNRWYEVHAYPAPEGISVYFRNVTERKAAEGALRDTEAKLRQLADAMPQIVWAARPDGTLDYYNRRWFEYIDAAPDAPPETLRWDRYVHPDDLPKAVKAWSESVGSGSPYGIEFRVRRADGSYEWFLVRALPVRDAAGNITRWFGTCTGIHEQKATEDALRRSREQVEMVVKGANVGVWYCPLPFDVLIWDDTVKEHFHLPPDAHVTIETFYERLHPDDRKRTRRTIEQSISRHEPYDIDYRTVSPDGKALKWVRATGRGFYDAAGNPTRFDGITIDVTERVRAEQRVREESNVIETINQVGRSVAAELDLNKLVQTVTDATTQLTGAEFGAFFYNVIDDRGDSYVLYTISGVPREKFAGFPMPRSTEVFAPTFRGEGVVRLADVTADPRYGKSAPFHGMPPGHLPVRSYLAVPVISRSGEVLGGLFFGHSRVGVFTERSEQLVSGISAQAAVAIDNARLFDAARRANAEKDKLLESERAARGEVERASRIKDEFLATLSHELRTPLNAILGWSQILRSAPPTAEDVREGMEIIERNARAQTQIIEDLLDMSRIISGKIRLDVQRFPLEDVVRAAVETVRPTANAKGVRLHAVLDPLAGPVSGDPNRLQQVFWNLLTNAVKFTPRGGHVQVLLERVNSHLEVSVTDTGEGIRPEFLPHVFDRFRQADASTTRRHGGLGLGLAIVKQLTELHGGSVRAKSAGPGLGTTFVISLPLTVLHPELEAESAEVERRHPTAGGVPVSAQACIEIAGVKVLVVDDEPDARGLVKRLLEECKAQVIAAASAAEAFQRLREERPDVLVSDIGMPGEDGYALIRKVRALRPDEGGTTPAIALTAYARSEDRTRSVLAGYQMHIAKPVEPAELVAIVASLAGRTSGQRV